MSSYVTLVDRLRLFMTTCSEILLPVVPNLRFQANNCVFDANSLVFGMQAQLVFGVDETHL